ALTAVLEYRPTETLPVLGAMLLDFARLCRHCRPAPPPKWRKTGLFLGTEAKSGERRTVCWRELDSKFQFRATSAVSRASRRCAMQSTRFGRTTVKRWVGDLETRRRNVIRT